MDENRFIRQKIKSTNHNKNVSIYVGSYIFENSSNIQFYLDILEKTS